MAPDIGTTWTILGVVFVLVLPLYTHAAYMLWKRWQTGQNTEDISENDAAIEENRRMVRQIASEVSDIKHEMAFVKNDLQVIHDLVAESNHCGAQGCRWCEPDDEKEE